MLKNSITYGMQIELCRNQGDILADARGEILRDLLASFKPGDSLRIPSGTYFFGRESLKLPDISIIGPEDGSAVLESKSFGDHDGTSFVLGNTQLINLTLRNTADSYEPTEDHRCVGFDPADTPHKAKLVNCRIECNDWAVYTWNNSRHSLEMLDCEVYSGRICIAAMGSGSGESQTITLRRCVLDVDTARSKSIGATSDAKEGGALAVVCKGGYVRCIDCDIRVVNRDLKTLPRCTAFVDWFHGNANPAARLEAMNCVVRYSNGGIVRDLRTLVLEKGAFLRNVQGISY